MSAHTEDTLPIGTPVQYKSGPLPIKAGTLLKTGKVIGYLYPSEIGLLFQVQDDVDETINNIRPYNIYKMVGGRRKRYYRTKKAHKKRRYTRRH